MVCRKLRPVWFYQLEASVSSPGDTERVVHEIVALEFLTMSWQVIRTDYWIGGTFSNLGKPFRWPFLRLFPSLYSPHPSVGIIICLSPKNANVLNGWSHRYIPIQNQEWLPLTSPSFPTSLQYHFTTPVSLI